MDSMKAKMAFRNAYESVFPTETFVFDDLPINVQKFIVETFPPTMKDEFPIISYFPNKEYFFLITTHRFCLFENHYRKSVLLSRVLEEDYYSPFEKLEHVGSGDHFVSKFRLKIRSLLFFHRYIYVRMEHFGRTGLSYVFMVLAQNGCLAKKL